MIACAVPQGTTEQRHSAFVCLTNDAWDSIEDQ